MHVLQIATIAPAHLFVYYVLGDILWFRRAVYLVILQDVLIVFGILVVRVVYLSVLVVQEGILVNQMLFVRPVKWFLPIVPSVIRTLVFNVTLILYFWNQLLPIFVNLVHILFKDVLLVLMKLIVIHALNGILTSIIQTAHHAFAKEFAILNVMIVSIYSIKLVRHAILIEP